MTNTITKQIDKIEIQILQNKELDINLIQKRNELEFKRNITNKKNIICIFIRIAIL